MEAAHGVDTLAAVALAVNPVLIAVLGYMLKRWIERLERVIESYGQKQTECQLTLAKVYRTKAEAEADSTRQWLKIDDHGTRITILETLLTGDGK